MAKIIKLRPKAKLDLKKIYKYSVENWGVTKADKYIKDLESTFTKLSNNKLSSNNADYIKPSILSYKVVSHVVFFSKTPNGIEVIRILHKSMDYKRHV